MKFICFDCDDPINSVTRHRHPNRKGYLCEACSTNYIEITPEELRELTGAKADPYSCVYCGDAATDREHVIPASWLGYRAFNKGYIVPACRECNSLAGSKIFTTYQDKREYVYEAIKRKHKKLLKIPSWSEDELEELDYSLRVFTLTSMIHKEAVLKRLKWAGSIFRENGLQDA